MTGDPQVFADTLAHEDGRRFAWFVSQSAETVTLRPQAGDGAAAALREPASGEAVEDVVIEPCGVRVVLLEGQP